MPRTTKAKKRKFTDALITKIAASASDAFWAKVGELVPEAKSGDFPPDALVALERAHETAIREFVAWNVPGESPLHEPSTRRAVDHL